MKGKAVLFAARHHRKIAWLKYVKFGEFETPSGTKYKGVKVSWKW